MIIAGLCLNLVSYYSVNLPILQEKITGLAGATALQHRFSCVIITAILQILLKLMIFKITQYVAHKD
jgi:hypothetical protein